MVWISGEWTGGDAGLRHLKAVKDLKAVYLVDAPISNAGLRHIAEIPGLQKLVLCKTPIDRAGLTHLVHAPNLSVSHLSETNVTHAGLAELEHLGKLRSLRLVPPEGATLLADEGVKQLARLAIMERLELVGDTFTDDSLEYAENVPKLRTIAPHDTNITNQGARQSREDTRCWLE